jgi:signal transduction histidine kinase/phage shock protein PspC (stress-responsive transcriptional regulator)
MIEPMALRRDTAGGWIAGVCAGIARHLGIDPLVVRIVFVAAASAGGVGLVAYALAWLLIPAGESPGATARRPRTGRGAIEVALGAGMLLFSLLLAVRHLGLPFSDAVVWPLVLVASGGALLWRQSQAATATSPEEADEPAVGSEFSAARDPAVVSRVGVGVVLVIGAGIAFLQATGALAAAGDVALAAVVVAIALGVIFAPWIVRLVRSLTAERAERIRSQERAEVAAHLHDSVLQTLALVQKRAADPREVAALARRQERELRAWLSDRPQPGAERRLLAALEAAAAEVEQAHGVEVDVVGVGDAPLDSGGEALVAAAREAIVNAAKFAGGAPVAVYAEAGDDHLQVFVRDRGPGFDPAAVPADRRGVRESIVGRMERHGGRATIHASPGGGTEVELVLSREGPT